MTTRTAAVAAVLAAIAVVAAVGVAGGVVAGDAAVGSAQNGGTEGGDEPDAAPTNGSQPGERLAGSVGVGEAELNGEIDSRAFAVRVREAETDGERADAVADRVTTSRDRLDEIRERRERLRERREAGEISEREYRVGMARLGAQARQVERATNETAAVAENVPADVLAARGVNATAIERLRGNAAELSGGEAAAIAREIAGARAGRQTGPPDRTGPPGDGADDKPGPPDDADSDAPASSTPGPSGDGAADGNETETNDRAGHGNGDRDDSGSAGLEPAG